MYKQVYEDRNLRIFKRGGKYHIQVARSKKTIGIATVTLNVGRDRTTLRVENFALNLA